jgi:small-conductance mechanosensitive channel
MLLEAGRKTPGLLQDPPPFVLQRGLKDFYVEYELNVYARDLSSPLTTYSVLHQNIQDIFNEHGVQIMSPNYEADPENPKIVPKDKWFLAPAKKPEA